MIQSIVSNCFNATKRSFLVNMWQWRKHGPTTSLRSQIGSQLSEQQQVMDVQRCKHQQAKFWSLYFGMCKVFLFINYLEKGRTINNEYYIALLVCSKEEITRKNSHKWRRKSALSPRQCTVSQVDYYDGKTTWIALWIASTTTLFSRSGPQQLLAVSRPWKNAPRKEIWLQWRSDIGNWGIFWGQRQIILQKRHRIVREVLGSVYHPRRRLLMNKVEFCLKVVVLLVRPRTYWVMCYYVKRHILFNAFLLYFLQEEYYVYGSPDD